MKLTLQSVILSYFLQLVVSRQATFLHISDIHYDPYYVKGGLVSTGCHRIAAFDEYNRGGLSGGSYGGRGCDTPWKTVDFAFGTLMRKYKSDIPNGDLDFDFVIYTGDSPRHSLLDKEMNFTTDQFETITSAVFNTFVKSLPGIPIIPTIGNNDLYAHDEVGDGPEKDYKFLYATWKKFIPSSQSATFLNGGYFYVDIQKNLRIISLNTLFFFKEDKESSNGECLAPKEGEDNIGYNQLTWLNNVLNDAEKKTMSVYIIGHVPPEAGKYFPSCFSLFHYVVSQHADSILGLFFGHQNVDALVDIRDKNNQTVQVARVHPSIIPLYNPSFRIYQIDGSSSKYGSLLNYAQYYLDLDNANGDQSKPVKFILEYDYQKTYGLKDLSFKSYLKLKDLFKSNPKMKALYEKYKTVSYDEKKNQ